MDTVTPGVIDKQPQALTADALRAAEMAVESACAAAHSGTFGVGGVLLGPQGELLAICRNCVVRDGQVHDPTAHGERQLVDWFYHNFPGESPRRYTIVSSLDPCMMCSGAILHAGFRVISVSHDHQAGVNFSGLGQFPSLSRAMREAARSSFGYYAVEGVREYQGPETGFGWRARLPPSLEGRSSRAFTLSVPGVQKLVYDSAAGDARDPAADSLCSQVLRELWPSALTNSPLESLLVEAAGDFNAAALVDGWGNLLALSGARQDLSPIRTALMELTRGYAQARRRAPALPHIKDCRLITLFGPAADGCGLMELGAYGSSLEGPLGERGRWQYFRPTQPQPQLEATLASLPPLYSGVIKLRVEPLP